VISELKFLLTVL